MLGAYDWTAKSIRALEECGPYGFCDPSHHSRAPGPHYHCPRSRHYQSTVRDSVTKHIIIHSLCCDQIIDHQCRSRTPAQCAPLHVTFAICLVAPTLGVKPRMRLAVAHSFTQYIASRPCIDAHPWPKGWFCMLCKEQGCIPARGSQMCFQPINIVFFWMQKEEEI